MLAWMLARLPARQPSALAAGAAFRNGGLCNYQVQLTRGRMSVPVTRDYMFEGERELRAR